MTLPLIVTFANQPYLPILLNWLRAPGLVDLMPQVRVVALDSETRDALPVEHVIYRPTDISDFSGLMVLRVRVLRELLATTSSLIHSDADAVWLQNPLPAIEACAADLCFSQGTVHPPDVHARHGVVVCSGFFSARNTPAMQHFLAAFEERVESEGSDQTSVNRLLDAHGVQWQIDDPYIIPFRGKRFTASPHVIRAADHLPMSVAILPHHQFSRRMETLDPEVIVAHPNAPKTCTAKIEVLSRLGLWF